MLSIVRLWDTWTDTIFLETNSRWTESQLLLTLQYLASALNDGKQIDVVLFYFSKAFDVVPHEWLRAKLYHYGIRGGHTLQWVRSILSSRSQQVFVEGNSSTLSAVTSGVPQGSVLWPSYSCITSMTYLPKFHPPPGFLTITVPCSGKFCQQLTSLPCRSNWETP